MKCSLRIFFLFARIFFVKLLKVAVTASSLYRAPVWRVLYINKEDSHSLPVNENES